MNRPWITWCGLAVVAIAAAVLSFDALRHLAVMVGTPGALAWLLPVTVDAAAVVATRVWLAGGAPARAWRFARVLALTMVALSVAGNAVSHWLVAYQVDPAWWAVVAVASVPPLVLGATAHLAALAATPGEAGDEDQPGQVTPGEIEAEAVALVDETNDVHAALGLPPFHAYDEPEGSHSAGTPDAGDEPGEAGGAGGVDLVERARDLVAKHGPMGRIRLARELDCTEHQARRVLAQLDDETRPVLHAVGGESR